MLDLCDRPAGRWGVQCCIGEFSLIILLVSSTFEPIRMISARNFMGRWRRRVRRRLPPALCGFAASTRGGGVGEPSRKPQPPHSGSDRAGRTTNGPTPWGGGDKPKSSTVPVCAAAYRKGGAARLAPIE